MYGVNTNLLAKACSCPLSTYISLTLVYACLLLTDTCCSFVSPLYLFSHTKKTKWGINGIVSCSILAKKELQE